MKGYTRPQTAKRAGVSVRTLDRYIHMGLVSGRIQYVSGHGHMRIFTEEEIDRVKTIHADQLNSLLPGLRKHIEEKHGHAQNRESIDGPPESGAGVRADDGPESDASTDTN